MGHQAVARASQVCRPDLRSDARPPHPRACGRAPEATLGRLLSVLVPTDRAACVAVAARTAAERTLASSVALPK
eukprot:scaffold87891_cov23-Tisochrysis_lutea.AAC.6